MEENAVCSRDSSRLARLGPCPEGNVDLGPGAVDRELDTLLKEGSQTLGMIESEPSLRKLFRWRKMAQSEGEGRRLAGGSWTAGELPRQKLENLVS